MIFGTEILDKFVFGDGSSFVDVHLSHDVLSDKLIIFGSYPLLEISLSWFRLVFWVFARR